MATNSDCRRCGIDTSHDVLADDGRHLTLECQVCGTKDTVPTG